jgi:hemerythrin
MDILRWDDERMRTGIPVIDDEHRQIIRDLNRLFHAHQAGMEIDELNQLLKAFCQFVKAHFQHEEALFEERHFKTRDEHRLKHAKFLREFQEMVAEFSVVADADQTAGDIEHLVARWFPAHIQRVVGLFLECPVSPEGPPAGPNSAPP